MPKTPKYILDAVKRYNQSDKGRLAKEKYRKTNADKISEYNKKYARERREKAKELGLCFQCNKPNPDHDIRVTCLDCRNKRRNKNG